MTRTLRIRLSLVSIATLLVVLGTMQTSHSQPPGIRGGQPGFPGPGPSMPGPGGIRGGITGISGISGRPPGFPDMPGPPGGISGISGGPPGFPDMPGPPGGISGISGRPPGFPEIPGPPDFPRPPIGPFGPGFGRRPGIGGLPGGPAIYDWSCSGCGRHLGTGPTPPLVRVCPGCGAKLEGSRIVDGPQPPGNGGMPGIGGPIMPPGSGPPALQNPGLGGPMPPAMVVPPQHAFDNNLYVPPANPAPVESNRGTMIRVVLITLGILLLLGIGIAAIVFVILKQQKPVQRKRPRRRPRYEDGDDY